MRNIVYRWSKSFFLTSGLTARIENRLRILYPSNISSIIRKTEEYLIKLYFSGFLTVAGLLMFAEFSVYYAVLTGMVIFIMFQEKMNEDFNRLEYKLLEQLLKFVEDVKFRFQFDGMLERSLIDAISEADYEISVHAQKIYECLMESYYHEKQEYIDISPNHFFLTFYSLCDAVFLYGDKKGDDGSIFLKNLGYLKEEINVELLKRRKIQGNFLGLKGISIIPLFAVKPIEIWAAENIPELKEAFEGSFGICTTVILFLVSIVSYKAVNILKFGSRKKISSPFIKKIASIPFVDNFIRAYISFNIKSSSKINSLLREVAYEYNIYEYTLRRFIVSGKVFIVSIVLIFSISLKDDISIKKIILSIITAIGITILSFFMSVAVLKIKKQLLLMDREEEIVRFQNIILMMMHMDKVTIEQIISEMERFAVVFKNLLENISDKFTYKGREVFREAKEKSGFRPFERLMDGFMACEDTYICVAFDDLEKDRRYFIDRHKQENERIISDKTVIAKTISFIPLCGVIILKLIIPFVLYGMSALQTTDLMM